MKFAHHLMTWEGWAAKAKIPFDLDTALAEAKASGYDAVELGGDEKNLGKPDALLKRLANHGLALGAFGVSVTANPWPPNTEAYRRSMDYAHALGVKVLAVCGGFLSGRRNTFEADYKLFASNLATAQAYADQYQQTIAYHPHVGCIVETQKEVEWLLRYIPGLNLCIDTGHLAAVHCDPIALLKAYPRKVLHVHLKDWSWANNAFAELGAGDAGINFKGFLAELERIGYQGYVSVERDAPPIPAIESARISRAFLAGL